MGWVENLADSVVGVDTAPFIYYVEAHPIYLPRIDPFFTALDHGVMNVVTSIVTLIETTIQPIRRGDASLLLRYEDLLLDTAHIDTIDLNAPIAQEAARLRAAYNLRTPDAIQVATALNAGAVAFLTNDVRLGVVPDISVVVLDTLPVA